MEKKKDSKKITISRFLYMFMIAIIIVLVVVILFFVYRTYKQYEMFKTHENYFKAPNQRIQSWMNIRIIERRFNITQENLCQVLSVNTSKLNQRSTLDMLCKNNHLNCTDVVNQLNNIKK